MIAVRFFEELTEAPVAVAHILQVSLSDDVPFLVSSNVKQIKERYPEDGLALTSIADYLVVDESILPFKDEIIVIDRDGKVLTDDWALMCLKEGMKGSWQLLGD